MAIGALEWASGGRKHTCLSKSAFLAPREDKISHFQSTQLHRGILKKTVLPYEERQEHSWKKNDCCTAWTNVILALSRPPPLLLPRLSAQDRADICIFRSSVCPSASGLWVLELHGSFNSFLQTKTISRCDLDWSGSCLVYECFLFKNPDGSEIHLHHPFSAGSRVKVFTVGEVCVSLPDLMRPGAYAFFKSWSQRSDSHSVLCRRVLARTWSGAPGQRLRRPPVISRCVLHQAKMSVCVAAALIGHTKWCRAVLDRPALWAQLSRGAAD